MPDMEPAPSATRHRLSFGLMAWFVWVALVLGLTGLLLPRIIAFVDFSEKAPFSLLGLFMMVELAAVLFGLTLVLQHKRAGFGFALGISLLPAPILAGLVPVALAMPAEAAAGWTTFMLPLGAATSAVLIAGLVRQATRSWFTEN